MASRTSRFEAVRKRFSRWQKALSYAGLISQEYSR